MVSIIHYDQILNLNDISFVHPLKRRMTEQQQMVTHLLNSFKESRADLWEYVNSYHSHIFHANTFGELDLSIKLADSVKNRSFPISPKDFQNSLYNIAMGYASIVAGFRGAYTCMSDSRIAVDRCLFHACKMIEAGVYDIALIINSRGSSKFVNENEFKAELICLGKGDVVGESVIAKDLTSKLVSKNEYDSYREHENATWFGALTSSSVNSRFVFEGTQEGIYTEWKM